MLPALSCVLGALIETRVIDAGDVAHVTGSTPRSVSRWTSARVAPRRDSEDRLLELKTVVDQLRKVLQDEPARLWLRSPNPSLDWEKPLDLVARGEYKRVIGAVLAVAEGVTG